MMRATSCCNEEPCSHPSESDSEHTKECGRNKKSTLFLLLLLVAAPAAAAVRPWSSWGGS